jgi:hypothetical protein
MPDQDLARTEALQIDPLALCQSESDFCTFFPENVRAAPDIGIFVNGEPRNVPWSTQLWTVVASVGSFRLFRLHGATPTPVELDATDPEALRLFLLPGDQIIWP